MGLGATQQQDAATVGSALLSTAAYTGPAAPFVAAAGAIADIVSLFGPNPNNTYATEVVNQVEADVMKPNLAGWEALAPADKTDINQQAAEANFTSGWDYVLQACGQPALGSSGTNCIADRQRGGKFDWWAAYYDPIADDPQVAINNDGTTADPLSSLDSAVSSLLPSSSSFSSWLPLAAVLAIAFMVAD
jgi:hypothetical protein